MKERALKDWQFLRQQAIKREQSHRDMQLDMNLPTRDRAWHEQWADHYANKRAHIDSEIRKFKR